MNSRNSRKKKIKKSSNKKEINLRDLISKLKKLNTVNTDNQSIIIQEFVDNKYFEKCGIESVVDLILFQLLNYAISLPDLINDQLVALFKMLFSHSNHCYFESTNSGTCKINLQLYRSNWLKVYFESVCKVNHFNLNNMCDEMIEFMSIIFKKSFNSMSKNLGFVPALDHLVFCTQSEMNKKSKERATLLSEKKRKIILFIIEILDGQYLPFLDKNVLTTTVTFVKNAGIF